jgi:hypothetical protein
MDKTVGINIIDRLYLRTYFGKVDIGTAPSCAGSPGRIDPAYYIEWVVFNRMGKAYASQTRKC